MCEALTVRLNLMISPRQMATLKASSKQTGAPVSELIRRAVEKAHPSPEPAIAISSSDSTVHPAEDHAA